MNIIEKLFGEVPEDWNIVRLSSYLKNEKNSVKAGPFGSHLTNTDMQGSDIKVYNQRTVLDKDFLNGEYYISIDKFEELKGFIVEPNDILVTTRGTIGKCVIVPNDIEVGILHPCLIKMKINEHKINPNYLEYIFNSTNIVKEQVQFLSNSTTIDVIYTQTLKDLNIALPQSISNQNKIVAYLDKKVAKIDILISKKEIKLNLLLQLRQSIITEFVTKGLDPNVKMKDSGVEWIGETPEHWDVKQIRRIVKEHRQGFYSEKGYVDDGYKLIRITDLGKQGNIDYSDSPSVALTNVEANNFALKEGDFLFARTGGAGSFGLVRENLSKVTYASYLIRFRFNNDIDTNFLKYYFLSDAFLVGVKTSIHGGVNQNIHAEDIKSQIVVIPTKREQKEIVDKLEKECTRINAVIKNILIQIEKLKEYRQSLIYEAVTGKIDVRDMKLD